MTMSFTMPPNQILMAVILFHPVGVCHSIFYSFTPFGIGVLFALPFIATINNGVMNLLCQNPRLCF